jgi:hypothetical protein
MFEEFMGIPAHPLMIHAAVVLLPLQVLAGLAYGLVGGLRRTIWWLVAGLAVAAPLSAFMAKLSGEAFRDRLIRNGTSDPGTLADINQHNDFGDLALYSSIALGVILLAMVFLHRRANAAGDGDGGEGDSGGAKVVTIILTIVMIVGAGATAYYVFKTGDSGARMVWTGL